MSFIDYINGKRKGKEANRFEKKSQRDPFLYEALEGYDMVNGDHAASINELKKAIRSGGQRRSQGVHIIWKFAAAIIFLVFGLGGYFVITDMRVNMSEDEDYTIEIARTIDIFVPNDTYEQNQRTIQNKNNILAAQMPTKKTTITTFSSSKAESVDGSNSGAEKSKSISVIDIYVPNDAYEQNEGHIDKGNSIIRNVLDPVSNGTFDIYVPEDDYERFKDKIKEV